MLKIKFLTKIVSRFEKPHLVLDVRTNYVYLISLLLIVVEALYVGVYLAYLPSSIPLWYFLSWGADILATKQYLFIIPALNVLVLSSCIAVSLYFLRYNLRSVSRFVSYLGLFVTVVMGFSAFNIIEKSKLVNLQFGEWFSLYFLPAFLAFLVTFVVSKIVIKNAEKLKIIEFPNLRDEPAKVLQKPTPRSGIIAFWAGFSLVSGVFLWYSQRVWGLIIGISLTTLAGYLDDRFKLSYLPRLLIVLPISILIVVLSGFVMLYIPNPFGEAIKLDSYIFNFELFGGRSIIVFAALAAAIWLMWMNQMLSFNNGIDGQFVAICSVTALVIGLLSFRFESLSYEQQLSAQISFITLGALLGMVLDTFPPQKVLWGWGSTGVGLIFGALSLLSGTRVATAFLILLIPSVDVMYVLFSRIKQGKSPFKGDRNHLHHKLLDIGWSKRRITAFYWTISILFGSLAYYTSGKSKALATLSFAGIVLFVLVVFRRYVDTLAVRKSKVN